MDGEWKDEPARKRARQGDSSYTAARRRAIAISAKMGRRFPYADYGRAYYKRGSALSLAEFGPSYKAASGVQKQNRRNFGFYGRGRYFRGRGGYFGEMIGKGLSKLTGIRGLGSVMSKAGDVLFDGSRAGRLLDLAGSAMRGRGMYTGTGAYSTVDNSLISGDTHVAPHFTGEPDGASVVISHREFVGNLYAPPSTRPFANQVYSINPGLEKTFPWLSQIAANYEEYEMKQLIFTYRSTVADFASNTGQVGQVLMATQYNNNQDPFYEKTTMMQYDGSMSGKTSQDQLHGVECDPAKLSGSPGHYIRVGPPEPEEDLNDYDHGQFNIAVADVPTGYNNQAVGEIWVSYTVCLRKPKFFTGRGLAISRDHFMTSGSGVNTNPLGSPGAGTILYSGQQNNIGCLIRRPGDVGAPANGFQIVFPASVAGNFIVQLVFHCASPSTLNQFTVGTMTPGGNVRAINDIITGSLVNPSWMNNTVSRDFATNAFGIYTHEFHFQVQNATSGADNTLTWSWGATAPSFGSGGNYIRATVDISEYNIGFNWRQDGSRDAIKYVDPAGVVQPW